MAFSDPQSMTFNGNTVSFPRIGFGNGVGTFQTADGLQKLSISHTANKRARHTVRLDWKKTAADPLFPDTNKVRTASCYLVVDTELTGFTVEELQIAVVGLATFLTASSAAATTKVLGGEV